MKDEAGLGLAIHWVQQALISAFGDNCPLRPVKTGRQSLKWISELKSLRRGVRRLCNKWRTDNAHCWGTLLRGSAETLRRYKRLPKGLRGVPLMAHPGQLGYTGLYLGTLRSGWDLWWLLPEGIHNLRETPWTSCLLLTSPAWWL